MARNVFSVPIFFIVFRETLEAAIIVSVLLGLVEQIIHQDPSLIPGAVAPATGAATPEKEKEQERPALEKADSSASHSGSVAAAVDDTTAMRDSCRRKHTSSASASCCPCISGKFVMRERMVCRMRSWMSTPWLIASAAVLMMRGTAEGGTAFMLMSRCSEPSEMATTFAFFVAQPMKTGLRSSSPSPPASCAVACSGEARRMARDRSAACVR